MLDTPFAGEEYVKPTNLAIDKRLEKNSHLWESDTTQYYWAKTSYDYHLSSQKFENDYYFKGDSE